MNQVLYSSVPMNSQFIGFEPLYGMSLIILRTYISRIMILKRTEYFTCHTYNDIHNIDKYLQWTKQWEILSYHDHDQSEFSHTWLHPSRPMTIHYYFGGPPPIILSLVLLFVVLSICGEQLRANG